MFLGTSSTRKLSSGELDLSRIDEARSHCNVLLVMKRNFYQRSFEGDGDLFNSGNSSQLLLHGCTGPAIPSQYDEHTHDSDHANNGTQHVGNNDSLGDLLAINSQSQPPESFYALDDVVDKQPRKHVPTHHIAHTTPATNFGSCCNPGSSRGPVEMRYPNSLTQNATLWTPQYAPLDRLPPHAANETRDQGPAVNRVHVGTEEEAAFHTILNFEMLPLDNMYSFQNLDHRSELPSTLLDFNIFEERLHDPLCGDQAEIVAQSTPLYQQSHPGSAPGPDESQIPRPSPFSSAARSASIVGDSEPAAGETLATSIHR